MLRLLSGTMHLTGGACVERECLPPIIIIILLLITMYRYCIIILIFLDEDGNEF